MYISFAPVIALTLLLAIASVSTLAGDELFQSLLTDFHHPESGKILAAAHRACFRSYPENSLGALRDCITLGVHIVEIDIRLTKDKQVVVFHDSEVSRMTDGWGYVSDMTLNKLKTLRLRERQGGYAAYITSEKIPTLLEFMEVARSKIIINIELKSGASHTKEEAFAAAAKLVKENHMANQVLWKIPDSQWGKYIPVIENHMIHALDWSGLRYPSPEIWQGYRSLEERLSDFEKFDLAIVEVIFQDIDFLRKGRKTLEKKGLRVMAIAPEPRWCGNHSDVTALSAPDNVWGALIEAGANIIMTDRPSYLLDYLSDYNRKISAQSDETPYDQYEMLSNEGNK